MRRRNGQLFAAKEQVRKDYANYNRSKEELKMLRKMQHLNIVNLVESFETPDQLNIVLILEYCHYGSLDYQLK